MTMRVLKWPWEFLNENESPVIQMKNLKLIKSYETKIKVLECKLESWNENESYKFEILGL